MNLVKQFFLLFTLAFSCSIFAEEETLQDAFISDDLFIYAHSGAGKNYRIVGTVQAGTEIKLTGNENNNYTEIIDPKGKKSWVESQYVSTSPSLRTAITELNTKLMSHNDTLNSVETELNSNLNKVQELTAANSQLNDENKTLKAEIAEVKAKLQNQDQEILTQWFFNGAIVLGFGFILGIILPKFAGKKRNSSSWS